MMTQEEGLEDALRRLIIAELKPGEQNGDLQVVIVDALVKKLAAFMQSSQEGVARPITVTVSYN